MAPSFFSLSSCGKNRNQGCTTQVPFGSDQGAIPIGKGETLALEDHMVVLKQDMMIAVLDKLFKTCLFVMQLLGLF